MILFYGKPFDGTKDEAASRAARLKILQKKFYEWKKWKDFAPSEKTICHAFNVAIQSKLLQTAQGGHLIINAHGNASIYSSGCFSGEEIANQLISAGLKDSEIKEIWVAACCVGLQLQDNTQPVTNFIKDLKSALAQKGYTDIAVYGPHGKLCYTGEKECSIGAGQKYLEYSDAYIQGLKVGTDTSGKKVYEEGEKYLFENGWVMAYQ